MLYTSKLKRKADKIQALDGIITSTDLQQIDGESSLQKIQPQISRVQKTRAKQGEGVRLNEAVGGIDVHKKVLAVAIAGPDGIIKEHEFLNIHESINDLINSS